MKEPFGYTDDISTPLTAHLPRLRPSTAQAFLPFTFGPSTLSGSGQVTFGANFSLETQFTGIRLILANYSTSAQTLGGICAAPTASTASVTDPVDGSGGPVAWTVLTVNGSQTPTLPAGSLSLPTYTLTDMAPIEGIASIDGVPFWRLMTRVASPAASFETLTLETAPSVINAATGARPFQAYYAAGNFALSNQSGLDAAGVAADQKTIYVVGVVFYSASRCVTLAPFGDSLTQGYATSTNYQGYGRIAVNALSNSDCAVSLVDGGFAGQVIGAVVARARALLTAGVVPHIMSLPIDSPNDYGVADTAAQRINQESEILSLIDYALSLGVVVVLMTGFPFGPAGIDAWSAQRVISQNKVRALTERGVIVADTATALCGYTPTLARPAVVPAALLSSVDNEHYNDAGQAVVSAVVQEVIRPLLY